MTTRAFHPRSGHQRGYVLLLTLLLIALAAAAMTGVSRRAMQKSLHASAAAEDLQRRWGVLTARSALLPKAHTALAAAEREAKAPRQTTSVAFRLGRQPFTVVFADEQAKLNVNTLVGPGMVEVERTVRQLISPSSEPIELLPLPRRADAETGQAIPLFQSLGQIFPSASPQDLLGAGEQAGLAGAVTCWTDSRVNFRRATSEVLQFACAGVMNTTQVQRLIELRNAPEPLQLPQILSQLQLTRAQRPRVEAILTESSTAYSVWIIVQTAHRRWYHLAVSGTESGKTDDQPILFEW